MSQESGPRIVIYYQTQIHADGSVCSILPLITKPITFVTHVNVAAIHLNDPPGNITLNDHDPSHPRYFTLWAELRALQASGVKVLGMLGGAAKGSFSRLDLDEETFELYYVPLRDMIRERALDGLDLDVEENMTLNGIIRLIDRLRTDFGKQFLITLAPVAAALISGNPKHNLSGFCYEALEVMRSSEIAWYNTQFYCGWGDLSSTAGYDAIIARGFPINKIVVGMVTNPANGSGWISSWKLQNLLLALQLRYPKFGGVMGWEYFNSLPGGTQKPWEWATLMTSFLKLNPSTSSVDHASESSLSKPRTLHANDESKTENKE
ncbi:BgTH12-04910 [Blumeria graminis f. sp. triticale]|uniref:Bgt-1267 n=3 Tax=Blumeria graminis TaxID=34373 RepID=A0A9X9L7V1_BLUGR|nr:BgTH12-04910 [Blumeria graminis f. sp. triticale]VCU39375.1 Bgt-1267 [Blumeria graminis f. sp. tritici]